ncbi:DUF92 domain-containing protein [Rossellomorea marisflavi]|uniref:DUF92 domain-containing protein n=1 Tax=Rossellomorea marisflavi TaxID=189381 RepID=UPI00345C9E8F
MGIEFIFSFIGIVGGAAAGWKLKFLTASGAGMAFLVGSLIVLGSGIQGLMLLFLFFITSSLFSAFRKEEKAGVEEKLAKSSTRDWEQVAANGGVPAIFAILALWTGDAVWTMGFAAAIASANSDTWASEIGPLSKEAPRHFLTFRKVERGTSGGVSILGTGASAGGALLIAGASLLLLPGTSLGGAGVIAAAGFLGSVFDTVIGGTIQSRSVCPECGLETESHAHCGMATVHTGGIPWMTNELVNFLSCLLAGILPVLFFW